MRRVFWLSFCDTDRPKGQQFLGASVVDVTDEDMAESVFPEPMIVAVTKAHRIGCNPGGEVKIVEYDDPAKAAGFPLGVLHGPRDHRADR